MPEFEKEGIGNPQILENLERKKRIKRTASILIVLILLVIVSVFIVLLLTYFKSPEKTLGVGANIQEALLSADGKISYVKLLGGSLDKNITKIKFIFTDAEGNEYNYETTEGIKEIEVPFKRSFWDWLFGRQLKGIYDYEINSDELGIENFDNINEVAVLFEYKTETGEEVETPVLDTTKPITTSPSGGGGDGNGRTTTLYCGDGSCNNNENCETCPADCGGCALIKYANNITQYNITWTFDKEYEYGTFANGDYWVANPDGGNVTIIEISPKSYEDGTGIVRHGSMINPDSSKGNVQGFDSRLCAWNKSYNSGVPNGNNISESNPLIIAPNSSLVSARSRYELGSWTTKKMQLLDVAVLTILDNPPPERSFRPPYAGNNKSVNFNINNINYSKLGNYNLIGNAPRLKKQAGDKVYDSLEKTFERTWLDYLHGACGSYSHPENNMPSDGGWLSKQVSDAAIILNSNYTNEDKKNLTIDIIQLGIDNFGIIETGAIDVWRCDGQIGPGRKFPILFAGIMLNNPKMKNIGEKSGDYLYQAGGAGNEPADYIHFAEDDQTFYVKESDIYNPPLLSWTGSVYAQTSTGDGQVKVSKNTSGSPVVVTRSDGNNWSGFGIPTGSYQNIVIKVSPGNGNNISDWIPGVDVNYGIAEAPTSSTNTINITTNFTGQLNTNYDYKIGYSRFFYGHGDMEADYEEYTNNNLGMPAWGIRHSRMPMTDDGLSWDMTYESQANWWAGFVLSAHMMNMENSWHNNALFDYLDRRVENKKQLSQNIGWVEGMWDAYRKQFDCVWTRNNQSDLFSLGHYNCTGCLHNCLSSPYCGDKICNGAETFQSCNYDCVSAPAENTFYVSVSGGATPHNGSQGYEFNLSQAQSYANNHLNDKITFLLASGDYGNVSFGNLNARGEWITFKAISENVRFLHLQIRKSSPTDIKAIFEGIHVEPEYVSGDRCSGGAFGNPCDTLVSIENIKNLIIHNFVVNAYIDDFGWPATFSGILIANSENITINKTEIHTLVSPIRVGYSINTVVISNNNIYNSRSSQISFDGAKILSAIVENNFVRDEIKVIDPRLEHTYTGNEKQDHSGPCVDIRADNLIIRNNTFKNCGHSTGGISIYPLVLGGYGNILIEKNLLYEPGSIHPHINIGNYNSSKEGKIIIRNNTMIADGSLIGTTWQRAGYLQISPPIESGEDKIEVYNNIIAGTFSIPPSGQSYIDAHDNIVWCEYYGGTYKCSEGFGINSIVIKNSTGGNNINPLTGQPYPEDYFENGFFIDWNNKNFQPISTSDACNGVVNPWGVAVGALPCVNKTCPSGLDSECNDINPCTADSCVAGICEYDLSNNNGFICNDGNECTTGEVCSMGSCIGNAAADGTSCRDDGLFCTGTETCQSGKCLSGGNPCGNDGFSCTIDCDETNNNCNMIYDHSVCEDSNECTSNTCNPSDPNKDVRGCVIINLTGSVCSDGIFCTKDDVCNNGLCQQGIADNTRCSIGFQDCTATCDVNLGCINYAPAGCNIPNVPSNYVAYWKLDDNTDDVNGINNGTFYGGTENYIQGVHGRALEFDGNNDYVSAGNMNYNDTTVSAWFKTQQSSNYPVVAGVTWGSAAAQRIYTSYGKVGFYVRDSNSNKISAESNSSYNDNNWHHAVGVKDGNNVSLYIDGNFVKSSNVSFTGNFAGTFNIGFASTSDSYFNGTLDEVMIYNRALNSSEIEAIYCTQGDGSEPFCDQYISSLSPFTRLWNFLKSLLTGKTGQAILTGKTITGNVVNENGERKSKVQHVILSLFALIILIIAVVIIRIKNKRKIKLKSKKRFKKRR